MDEVWPVLCYKPTVSIAWGLAALKNFADLGSQRRSLVLSWFLSEWTHSFGFTPVNSISGSTVGMSQQ